MKVQDLQDGHPGGCIQTDALMLDQEGRVWVDREAEIFQGKPNEGHPISIRRNLELFDTIARIPGGLGSPHAIRLGIKQFAELGATRTR